MDLNVLAALASGFLATIVMTLMMTMARRMGMTAMPPMTLVTASMMSGDRRMANAWGAVIHYVVMGAVVFGLLYAWVFGLLGIEPAAAWWMGAIIGLVHGLLVGALAMPMMPRMHPRMSPAPATTSTTPQPRPPSRDDEVRLDPPGFMGAGWGGMTPTGIVAGHIVFGAVLGLLYGLFA